MILLDWVFWKQPKLTLYTLNASVFGSVIVYLLLTFSRWRYGFLICLWGSILLQSPFFRHLFKYGIYGLKNSSLNPNSKRGVILSQYVRKNYTKCKYYLSIILWPLKPIIKLFHWIKRKKNDTPLVHL